MECSLPNKKYLQCIYKAILCIISTYSSCLYILLQFSITSASVYRSDEEKTYVIFWKGQLAY